MSSSFRINSICLRQSANKASSNICIGIPSCLLACGRATVSASAVELLVEPWRRTAQEIGHRRPVCRLISSRSKLEVLFVSSVSPAQWQIAYKCRITCGSPFVDKSTQTLNTTEMSGRATPRKRRVATCEAQEPENRLLSPSSANSSVVRYEEVTLCNALQ